MIPGSGGGGIHSQKPHLYSVGGRTSEEAVHRGGGGVVLNGGSGRTGVGGGNGDRQWRHPLAAMARCVRTIPADPKERKTD